VWDQRQDEHNMMEAYSETKMSPTRILGPMYLQIESHDTYGLGF
jgi:hypothetical protein